MIVISKKKLCRTTGKWLGVVLPAVACLCLLSACSTKSNLVESSGLKSPLVPKNQGELMIWFVKPENGELSLVAVKRKPYMDDQLEDAVKELLDGPNQEESASGLSSEIPKGTLLLGVKHVGGDIELNLSKRFASGGGTTSIQTRLDQLSKTAKDACHGQKVYLAVEGERLTLAGGEGIEVKQPIN